MNWDLIVIGGGAAGFFGAIQTASLNPHLKILILEKSPKLLSKVRISGGGRCNVTHNCSNPFELARHYPRGARSLKALFKLYDTKNVTTWFASKGVMLKTENDGRMFPVTDNSQTIIDCFLQEANRLNIEIQVNRGVTNIEKINRQFRISTQAGETYEAKKILVAAGGNSHQKAYEWIAELGHSIVKPVPSLFTFNDKDRKFTDLMGISVPHGEVKITGTKFVQRGPVLITHWGLSGPAVIKLSAWAAEYLHQVNYHFDVIVSWIGAAKEEESSSALRTYKKDRAKQKIINNPGFFLPQRLWQRLCELSGIEESKVWGELPQRNLNRLLEYLIRCPFHISGKTTFKEEFVTCGGVSLTEIDSKTMESKLIEDLYFAGEVLNIDGETGGFNFQAAWTTAYLAAKSISASFYQC
jgi:predicted Rossmann fold flavoprotein